MKGKICCAFLVLMAMVWGQNLRAGDVDIAAGTLVQCTVDEPNFSTRTAKVDEPLVCYARPIRVFDCSDVLGGSELAGRLTDEKQPGRFYGKGWMLIEFDRLIVPQGGVPIAAKVISVQGMRVDAGGKMLGKGHPLRDAAEWSVPVLWPLKIVTLPRRGPPPTLRGERVVTLRLMDDLQVPCSSSSTFGSLRWNANGLAR